MRRPFGLTLAGLLAFLCAAPEPGFAQSRKLRPIPRPEAQAVAVPLDAPDLPSSSACAGWVRVLVARWGERDLAPLLADDFPNRGELLDALERARLRASRIELRLEAIEQTRFTPWTVERTDEALRLTTYCTAEIRTLLLYDDPSDGERVRRVPGRTQLRIRFTGPEVSQ